MKDGKDIKKNIPTIFPLGFSISTIEGGEIVIIDFIDKDSGRLNIIGSFALTSNKVKELVTALTQDAD